MGHWGQLAGMGPNVGELTFAERNLTVRKPLDIHFNTFLSIYLHF
jgi:hypothetical protein